MGIFTWLFGKRPEDEEEEPALPEQAVLVYLKLSDDDFGTEDEREVVFALEAKLIEAIEEHQSGEYDGNEFGGGFGIMFMYGVDAKVLYDSVSAILSKHPMAHGSYVIKRFGPDGAKEERIDR